MFDWLVGFLSQLVCWVKTAAVEAFNAVIAAIGGLIGWAAGLLPSLPSLPSLPEPFTQALGWIAWFFPVATLVQVVAFLLAAWLIWIGVSIGLRWARAL